MGMARIPGATPAEHGFFARQWLRLVYWLTRRRVGRVVMPVQILGHQPGLLTGYGMMEDVVERAHRVPPRIRSLAQVRAATRIGCPF